MEHAAKTKLESEKPSAVLAFALLDDAIRSGNSRAIETALAALREAGYGVRPLRKREGAAQ